MSRTAGFPVPAAAVLLAAAILAGARPAARTPAGQTPALPIRLTAQAVNLSPLISLPPQTPMDIVISRWSTTDEQERFVTAAGGDVDDLLDAIKKSPRVGFFRVPTSVGVELHFAMVSTGRDGRQHITAVTERTVTFAEAVDRSRRLEYRFLVLELQLDRSHRGEGRLTVATRITRDRILGDIRFEPWENMVVSLRDVRPER